MMAPPSVARGQKVAASAGPSRLLSILGIVLAVVASAVFYIERNLESFYIFDKAHLLDLSNRAIKRHSNDTVAIVDYIVKELQEKHPNMINPRHDDPNEWVFNNHGGAMGSMYIIHASKSPFLLPFRQERSILMLDFLTQASPSTSSSMAPRSARRDTRADTRPTTTSTS
jgi:hypothetical protein